MKWYSFIVAKKHAEAGTLFEDFEEALKHARTLVNDNPYVEIRFCAFNSGLADGFITKTIWTAQDDVEA